MVMINNILHVTLPMVGGVSVLSIALYFIKNPEKFEKWIAILCSCFRYISKSAEKTYIKFTVQSVVNGFIADLSKEVPNIGANFVKLNWIDEGMTEEQFFHAGQLVVRMRKSTSKNRNIVNATAIFVSQALMPKAKSYIANYQKEAIDLFATTKILSKGEAALLSEFVELYLRESLEKEKVNDLYGKFEEIHRMKLFFPVFITELNFLGEKVFGKKKQDKDIYDEVNRLTNFLLLYSKRKEHEEVTSDFDGAYCKFAIRIVGKYGKILREGEQTYLNNIDKLEGDVETLYLLGNISNHEFIDSIVQRLILSGKYTLYNTKDFVAKIKNKEGKEMKVSSHLVVLRSTSIRLYHND